MEKPSKSATNLKELIKAGKGLKKLPVSKNNIQDI